MKRPIVIIFLLLLAFVAGAKIVEKTYYFNHYTLSKSASFDFIQFEGLTLSGIAGQPALPWQAVRLALPPGEEIDFIEVIPGTLMDIPGTYQLYPMQHSQPLSKDKPGILLQDKAVYNSTSAFPTSQYGKATTEYLKGISIGMTTITPVLYFPKQGKLKYYTSVKVRLHTKPGIEASNALENLVIKDRDLTGIKQFIQNSSILSKYPIRKTSLDNYQYEVLIITGLDYMNSFDPLVNLYRRRGLRCFLTDVTMISQTMVGQDLQEKIRNYIKQEYQLNGIDHVIIGGDVNIVPVRGLFCHVQSSSVYEDDNIPSDLYYSALDGSWNDNGNQKWGEIGEDDLLPEVSIGRIPFSDDQEAAIMINKSIDYQNTPVVQDLNRVLLLGEQLWESPVTWGGDFLDLLVGHKTDNGYTTDGIYDTSMIETLYDRDLPQPWDVSQLLSSLNEGKPTVYHCGHAASTYNMRMYSWDINENSFLGMDGITHNYCVIYSHGCYSGSFDDEDCIAEDMLKLHHFAVEYVGNSRYGWFNEGQTEGPSEHLNREFVNALYHNEDYRIGETHRQSRLNSASWVNAPGQWEEGALRWCYYDCNVLGDPLLGIWTDIPVAMQITCPSAIPAYSDQMTVNVQDISGAVEGVTCALVAGTTLFGAAVTDNTGTAIIHFYNAPQTPVTAEMVVSGYNRLATATPVTITGTVGINSHADISDLVSLAPNPCKDRLSLNLNSVKTSNLTVSLYSMEGRLLHIIHDGSVCAGQNSINLDDMISNISAGIYYVKAETGNSTRTFKLLKN